MRPLIMDFNDDTTAVSQAYEYMFGKAFLIAPVTAPNVTDWNVYLPKQNVWYDFWTGKRFEGGQTIASPAPLERIPVFVKEGSIVPMGNVVQSTQTKQDILEIRVYTGKDATFTLYNDEGDNYNYEKGEHLEIPFTWNEKNQSLTIENQVGNFKNKIDSYTMNVIWVTGNQNDAIAKTIKYSGKKVVVKK